MKNKKSYIASFLIAICIMELVYLLLDIGPFRNKDLLTLDLSTQYVKYLAYFKDMIAENGVFYSFVKGLGSNMFGFNAYYLISPFNLIFLFVDKLHFPDVIHFLTLIRVGLCAVTFSIFLKHAFKESKNTVLFSLCYAFMSYAIVYQQNIIWLDTIILFPLVMLGITKLVKENKSILYIVTLALSIIFNYYMGFIVCIASVLYYVYLMFLENDLKKVILKKSINFLLCSLTAGFISMIVVLPAVLSLGNTYNKVDLSLLVPTGNFEFGGIFSKLLIGSFNYEEIKVGFPNMYIGLLPIVLLITFMFNNKISRRDKIINIVFILVMLVSFHVSTFNMIWHGLKYPLWFLYRNAFVLSFFLIVLSYRSFINIKSFDYKKLPHIFVSLMILFIVFNFIDYDFMETYKIYLSAIFMLLYFVCLYFIDKKNINKLLLFLVSIELFVNSLITISHIPYKNKNWYDDLYTGISPIVSDIKSMDKGMYRIEKTLQLLNERMNDGMLFNYYSISHNSSSDINSGIDFLNNFGSTFKGIRSSYVNNTYLIETLLGIKYLISSDSISYKVIDNYDGVLLYENPYYLSFGYMVNNKSVEFLDNSVVYQNDVFNALFGVKPLQIKDITNYVTYNLSCVDVKCVKTVEDEDSYISFDVDTRSMPTSLFISTEDRKEVNIYLDDVKLPEIYLRNSNYNTIYVGNSGVVNVKVLLKKDSITLDYLQSVYTNLSVLESIVKNTDKLDIVKHDDSSFTGNINVTEDNKVLFLPIVNDKGIVIKVDGKVVEHDTMLDAFISIPLDKGSHTIEFGFKTNVMYYGLFVSIIGMLLFVIKIRYIDKKYLID